VASAAVRVPVPRVTCTSSPDWVDRLPPKRALEDMLDFRAGHGPIARD
jgi:hypothetical protein